MEKLYYGTLRPRLKEVSVITVCCSDRGIRAIHLGNVPESASAWSAAEGRAAPAAQYVRRAVRELEEYFAGRRRNFTVPLDVQGTSFQRKVWSALREIPYGETRSYGQIARRAGHPKAARAVGMANHCNPVAIVVPCHRVIASDGTLGGYAGGLGMKAALLALEGATGGTPWLRPRNNTVRRA